MQIKYSASLKVSLINFAALAISILMLLSPLGTKSGAINQVLILPLLYCAFSFVPPIIGIILGILEKIKSKSFKYINLGLGLNTAYLFLFSSYIYTAWAGWMGV